MSVEVQMIPADHLLAALKDLRDRHRAQGRVSHACGVQTAINLVQQANRRSAAQSVVGPAAASARSHVPAGPEPAGP